MRLSTFLEETLKLPLSLYKQSNTTHASCKFNTKDVENGEIDDKLAQIDGSNLQFVKFKKSFFRVRNLKISSKIEDSLKNTPPSIVNMYRQKSLKETLLNYYNVSSRELYINKVTNPNTLSGLMNTLT